MESVLCWFAGADAILVTPKKNAMFVVTISVRAQTFMAYANPIIAA